MYGVSEGPDLGWGSGQVLASAAAGIALLVAMAAVELRTAEPIVALRLLGNRLFRSSAIVLIPASIAFAGTLSAIGAGDQPDPRPHPRTSEGMNYGTSQHRPRGHRPQRPART
jgi:hypothetical protein